MQVRQNVQTGLVRPESEPDALLLLSVHPTIQICADCGFLALPLMPLASPCDMIPRDEPSIHSQL